MSLSDLSVYLAEFEKNGAVIVKGLLADDVIQRIYAQAGDVMDQSLAAAGVDTSRFSDASEKYLYLKDHHPKLKSHCYDIFKRIDSVMCALTQPFILKFVQSILGRTVIVDGAQIRLLDPENERFYPIHQEFGQISECNVTCWVALSDIPDGAGGLRIVPGSHRQGALEHRFLPDHLNYHAVVERELEGREIRDLTFAKGDALFFHPNLLHGSAPNRTRKLRWSIIGRYNDVQHVPYLKDEVAPIAIPQVG